MTQKFVDLLESRMFLSAGGDDFELAVDPGITEDGVMMTLAAPKKAASPVKKGYYSNSATLGDKKGNVILQVSSVSSTGFSGVLKSADWGAFSVSVTGTISGSVVKFSGKNSYTNIKSFAGTISENTLSGKLSIVQNGISISGKFTASYSKTAPSMADVIEPNVLGTYSIKSSDSSKTMKMVITSQADGKISGKIDGNKMIGVILSSGEFKMVVTQSDGKTEVEGKRTSSKGNMSGKWHWYGNDGENDNGTFTATKK